MGGLNLHQAEAIALPFLQMLRPAVCFCVCQVTTCVIAYKQRGKKEEWERDTEKRNKAEGLEIRDLFISVTIPISISTGISSTLNDVSHS